MKRRRISYHFRKTEQYRRLAFLTMFFKLHSSYRALTNFQEMIEDNPGKDVKKVEKFKNDFNNMFNVERKLEDFIASDDKITNITIDIHNQYKDILESLSILMDCDKDEMERCVITFDHLTGKGKNFRTYKKFAYLFFHVYLSQFVYYMDGEYDSDDLTIRTISIDDVNVYMPDCMVRDICRIAEEHIFTYFGA